MPSFSACTTRLSPGERRSTSPVNAESGDDRLSPQVLQDAVGDTALLLELQTEDENDGGAKAC